MIRRFKFNPLAKWGLAVALSLLAFAAIYFSVGRPNRTGPLDRMTLAVQLHPTSILAFIALDQGYFLRHGLEIAVKTYPSGKVALERGLFSGEADIALANDVPVMLAGFTRSDFRIIGVDVWADNVNKIVARKDSKIASLADLRGKRIATQHGSAVHYFLHLLLLRLGLTEHDVNLSFFDPRELVDALAQNRIDAFSMREPIISQARARLGSNALVLDAPGLYEQVDLMVMRKASLDRNPGLAVKYLEAMLDSESFLSEHPAQSARIVARFLKIDPKLIEPMLPSFRAQVSLPQSWFVLMESEARWAMQDGLVGNAKMPNYLDLIYSDALRHLKPEAVTLIR